MGLTRRDLDEIAGIVESKIKNIMNDDNLQKFADKIISNISRKYDEIISDLKLEMEELKNNNKKLALGNDNLEQQARLKNIRIFGIQVNESENLRSVTLKIIQEKLKIKSVNDSDITKYHRIPSRNINNDGSKPPSPPAVLMSGSEWLPDEEQEQEQWDVLFGDPKISSISSEHASTYKTGNGTSTNCLLLPKGAKSEIWAVKTSASVERPRYVIVCFQKSKRDNAEADATHFDNTSIVSIRLALNGEYWPNERMQLDFAKQDYTLAYYNYTRFYSSYSHSTEVHPILDYGEFKQHALFVIDCSRQEETMKSSTVDIKLEIEADKGFPADTKAYCIIVHDGLLEYFPLTEVVRTLI
ncbi:unnamed protein product [Phaedon cochleariae]|uniref:Double jelly roll-like domain-containing protein n=1 Tax=Phaedon cochleariae TaxID=80249 RepID=A0A9N9SF61_PHACE|nr:unnamed protein product [Phaedon cochleariae]